jgi:autotransporter-associated beta strand protein
MVISNAKMPAVKRFSLLAAIALFTFANTAVATDYYWDNSTTAGYQVGNGTWGTNNYWSTNGGTTLVAWAAGNTAVFDGSNGPYQVTLGSAQSAAGVTFNFSFVNIKSNTLTLTGAATVGVTNAGTYDTIVSIIAGTAGLTKSGGGTLVLSTAANIYSGGTTVSAGALQIGDNSTVGSENVAAMGAGTVTVNTGGTLYLKPGSTGNTYNITNSFTLNGGIVVCDDGAQHLGYGGAAFAIGANGGTVEASYNNKPEYIDGQITGSTTLALCNSPSSTIDSAFIHITNSTNTFSGTVVDSTSVWGMIVYLDNNTALQNATVRMAIKTGETYFPRLQLNATGTTIIAGLTGTTGKVYPSTTAGSYTLNVNNAANNSFSGVLQNNTGVLALTKSGAGTLTLSTATNTYSGGTTINAGTIQIGDNATPSTENVAALGTGPVSINTGGTLWLRPGGTGNTYNIANSFTLNGGTIIGEDGVQHLATGTGATFAVGTSGGSIQSTWAAKDVYIDGVLSGSGPLTIGHGPTGGQGIGLYFTNAANSYSGTITITPSTQQVIFGAYNATSQQYATIALASGGGGNPILWVITPNVTTTIAGLTGSTGIVEPYTTAGNYTLNVNNTANNTFGGILQNNTGVLVLTKSGAGALTLSGANTYSGGTTLSSGTLFINNSSGFGTGSGAVTCNGGTLGGTGTISGAVTMNSGSTLAPGTVNTQLSMSNNLTFKPVATFTATFNGPTHVNCDRVNVTGQVDPGNATLSINLGYAPSAGDKDTIIRYGTKSSNTFNGLAEGAIISVNSYKFTVSYVGGGGNAVVLTALFPPGNLTYSTNPASYVAGTAIPANSPTSSGSPVVSYSVSPALPAGLTLNTSTGVITGTPTTVTATASYTVTATNAAGSTTASLSITVTPACSLPTITTPPASQTVPNGDPGTFTVSSPNGTSYQWQNSPDGIAWNKISGATGTTLSFTATADTSIYISNMKFRCLVTNSCGTDTSIAAILTVCTPPTIIGSPQVPNQSVIAGQAAIFSISTLYATSFQWQISTDNGVSWPNAGTGSTSATYTVSPALQSYNGNLFRCIVSNSCKIVTSNSATLSVCTQPTVTNPTPQSAHAGDLVTFSVTGTGSGTVSYKWQDSIGGVWSDINSATNSVYSFNCTQNNNGHGYRCHVSNGCGADAYSNAALLTVCTPPSIGTNPTAQSVTAGQSAIFTVAASGVPAVAYQWQDSAIGSSGWVNINTATNASYSIPTTSSDNGTNFRCIVFNGCGANATSNSALLTVCTPPYITGNPVSQSDTAGRSASFLVIAAGSPNFSFQWQDSAIGGSGWTNIPAATNALYSFTPASNQDGWKFRCNVSSTSTCGTPGVSSAAATLSVCTPPTIQTIQTQPLSTGLKQVGDAVSFTVAMAGGVSSPSYQWQESKDNGTSWPNASGASATTATYSFTVAAGDTGAGVQFRCYISNGCGSVNSNIVTVSGCTPPSTTNPADQTVIAGNSVTFTVTGTGTTPLSFLWQDSTTTGWVNVATGGTAASYSFPTLANMSGTKFRCSVTGQCGSVAYSNSAMLTVCTPPSTISSQPVSQTKKIGDDAVFSVTLPGDVSSPVYQWQDSVTGGTWLNAPGTSATTPACTVAVVAGEDGMQFRCKITNSCGTMYSNNAMLSICTPPAITTPPADLAATAGLSASFTVVAGGTGSLTYQWQDSVPAGVWVNVATGGTSATYTFTPVLASQDGWRFRCIVSNGCGSDAISAPAAMSVCTVPKISLQPSNQDKNIGDTAQFTVSATGSSLVYQWQRSADGATWANVTTGTGGVTPSYSLKVAAADTNAKFRCKVGNSCGQDSSLAVTIIVCLPPKITAQPRDTSVVSGTPASFGVTCTGTSVTYQWQRSKDALIWADIANQKNASYSITPADTDNNAKFRCSIKTRCGDTTSSVANLTVWTTVVLDSQFVTNKSVLAGDTVLYRVVAHGTSLVYSWQKKTAGGSVFTAIVDSTPLYSFVAQSSDSASQYRCIVSGKAGTPCTTLVGQVLVYVPLHAAFKASVTSGQAPLTVQFTDSSTGSFTLRVWDFGDGSKPDSSTQNPSHLYSTANTYTVKLTVWGPAPRVASIAQTQIFTWNAGDNTMQMSGSYVPQQKVAYVISNYNAIVPPSAFVSVDTVILWYKAGGLPQTAAASTRLKVYTLAALKARGSQYPDTVTMPLLSGSDSLYGFMTSILWTDGKLSTFSPSNGTTVLMKDTTPVTNQLIISGTYIPDSTARIFLDNVDKIDTSRVDTVGVWFSLATGTPNFKDTGATRWMTARSIVAGGGTRCSLSIVNPQFNNVKTTMNAAVVLLGKNDRSSPVKQTSFSVGKDRPTNPIRLYAKALSSNRIRLSWNNVASTGIERIFIWYRAGSPVPKSYDLTSLKLDSLVPSVSDTVIIGDKFTPTTKYYFGAQVYRAGLWSYVTDSSSAADSTWAAGAPLDSNSCRITRLYLDTLTNQIRVCWTVDPAQAESLQVGILYSTASVPVTNTGTQQVVDVKAAKDSTYIKLHENLRFNATYYVSLWLRRAQGSWTFPTSKSVDSVKIGGFTWQSVLYFSTANDTVFAFNNSVRLTNTPDNQSKTDNVVVYTNPSAATAALFIPVSVGVGFKVKDPGLPFYVGLRVDSLPKGYSLADVRIYHRNADGLWFLDDNPVVYDSAGNYVSVYTNQLGLAFYAMIDASRPVEKVVSIHATALAPGIGYSDTIHLSDNIANLKWRFLSAKGGSAWSDGDTSQSGELSDTGYLLVVTVSGDNVSADNGVRAILIVSDGAHLDTVDLSESVARDTSGVVHTEALKWTPLGVSVDLDTPAIKKALAWFNDDNGGWTYDPINFRIFKWNSDRWLEFADSIRDEYNIVRGSLAWIKTKKLADVFFGRGATPSLSMKKPFVMPLPPRGWTDFCLPYAFNIVVGDILNATKSDSSGKTDSLAFCTWKKDDKGGYHSAVLFMKALGDSALNNESVALTSSGVSGFTAYNPYADTVFLRIPPLPQALSRVGLKKAASRLVKKAASGAWAIRVAARLSDSTEVSPVYCGFSKAASAKTSYYPAGPSFADAGINVYDPDAKITAGHAVMHESKNGGYAFLLSFTNATGRPERIAYRLENLGRLPSDVTAAVYNENTQRFEDLSHGDATVPLAGNSRDFRWLLVGNKDYLAKASLIARPAMLALVGTYPNPFRSSVRIRYDLPYDGVDKVRFFIFDLRGRVVWNRDVACSRNYGPADLTWSARSNDGRPISAGIYIVKMVALNGKQKVVAAFERKMTFMP